MGIFDFLRGPDINAGIREYQATPGAVLLDVRTSQEYREGHIPGSKNLPLQNLEEIDTVVDEKQAPVFVHCLSGGRSRQAAQILTSMGYTQVKNIGGLSAYTGKVER